MRTPAIDPVAAYDIEASLEGDGTYFIDEYGMDVAKFPEALKPLFEPHRYKIVYGGRGSGKSWGFARALLLKGIEKPLRILCTRETQKSIKDSVHKLIADQIKILGIESKYEVFDQSIRGSNGTEFIFAGLGSLTIQSIKSYEGCDIVWVEEGQFISAKSWGILIPTIRKEEFSKEKYDGLRQQAIDDAEGLMKVIQTQFGFDDAERVRADLVSGRSTPDVISLASHPSEIWVSFNPELETDATYEKFVRNSPPDAVIIKMNWRDNPWYNRTMDAERRHCLSADAKNYPNIWEGECLAAVEGAIFFDELQAMEREKRIRNVPYDPMLKVHIVHDLGFGHAMACALVQVMGPEIRVIKYDEHFNTKLSVIAADLKTLKYNWGKVWLPHADGFSKSSKGQDSAEQIWKAQGFTVAPKGDVSSVTSVEQGITVTRERFSRFYWDRENCVRLVECGRRYRRSINSVTKVAGAPLNDEYADGGDTTRYIAINANQMTNDTDKPKIAYVPHFSPLDPDVGY